MGKQEFYFYPTKGHLRNYEFTHKVQLNIILVKCLYATLLFDCLYAKKNGTQ